MRAPPRLLLLLLQPLLARASCVLDGAACVCTDADGEAWDVSDLQGLDITTTGDITGCALCEGEWTCKCSRSLCVFFRSIKDGAAQTTSRCVVMRISRSGTDA